MAGIRILFSKQNFPGAKPFFRKEHLKPKHLSSYDTIEPIIAGDYYYFHGWLQQQQRQQQAKLAESIRSARQMRPGRSFVRKIVRHYQRER